MQTYVDNVIAKRVELALCVVEGEAEIKQVPVTRRVGLIILFATLSDFGLYDEGVVEVQRGMQGVAIGQSDECENKND